jgi:GSCFA family
VKFSDKYFQMQFQLNPDIKPFAQKISYTDKIMLMGSCFTEHIGNALADLKFQTLQNPNGILYSPDAVCRALNTYISGKEYNEKDLFYLNEVWNSWQHHSRFSNIDKTVCLQKINVSQKAAHEFLTDADWLIITLGSAFCYVLDTASVSRPAGNGVANCHRAPTTWFKKILLPVDEIIMLLNECIANIKVYNSKCKIIFTVSPVRHIRDGIVENNRSKARLIEAVHSVIESNDDCFYFPAYELVIDVLRDYRFYDSDLVHPNYAAAEFVMEKFIETCMDARTPEIMQEVRQLVIARKHRPFQPQTRAHAQFLQANFTKAVALQEQYPFLNLKEEIEYFSSGSFY